jgi:Flp pilus assembly protein TadD
MNQRILSVILGIYLSLGWTQPSVAQNAATLFSKEGTVELQRSGESTWSAITTGSALSGGDAIRTAETSRAALLMSDGLMIRLNQNALFRLQVDPQQKPKSISIDRGNAYFFSREPSEIPEIKTPVVSASIRGTEFVVNVSPEESQIQVLAGEVVAANKYGSATLHGGEQASTAPGKGPVRTLLVNPLNAVQWALYYPAISEPSNFLDERELLNPAEASALEKYRSGDSDSALEELRAHLDLSKLGTLFLAGLHLERGQVIEAEALHHTFAARFNAAAGDKSTALYHAQKAIIALTKNRLEEAEESVAAAGSATAASALALSFVQQAKFDLDGAKTTIGEATSKWPTNRLLKLRQAELSLSFGDLEEAERAVDEASTLASQGAAAHTMRGFIALSRKDSARAEQEFSQAIAASSTESLGYLGLGLTQIRQGQLTQGRLSIQKAVHLDPSRALYRSYLGKALFEEEQEGLSAEEFERAITLDPNDPTPYLYRAFQRLSTHRPVAALEDVEQSIARNENRSVYRSRLLLDQDSSVRSNSLAQVYDVLGFSEVSRIEAIKSLSRDYSNYSAHLQLSNSYEEADRLTQAGLSEFFIARLLSPVNFNLVRPSQSGLITSNEYSAVFDRDLDRVSVDVAANSKDRSFRPHALYSGTTGSWGYAMDYSYTYADGYRDNDYERENSLYGAAQYQLGSDNTFLFDANLESFNDGDTDIGIDPSASNSDQELSFDDYFFRLGFNHRFSPGSQLIGQVVRNHSNLRKSDETFDRFLFGYAVVEGEVIEAYDIDAMLNQRLSFKSDGVRADLQHIYTSEYVSNVLGGGVLDSTQKLSERGEILDPEVLSTIQVASRANNTEGSARAFDYLTLHPASWIDFELGVSFSHLHLSGTPLSVPFSESTETVNKWDPKVGVVVTPSDQTTLRAAYFETVGTAGVREFELIEPTTISGFNQTFFDLYPGTQARNRAVGIDHKFSTRTYLGAEALHRDVIRNSPITVSQVFFSAEDYSSVGSDIFVKDFDAHLDEDVLKAYVYQVLGSRSTATLDYLWTKDQDHFLENEARTHRARLGLNYFDPTGALAFARGTWRTQELRGFDAEGETALDGNRDFWIVDVGVGYRFPKRHGQVTLTVQNILDQDFTYAANGLDPLIFPGIGAALAFSYNF